MDIEFPKAAEIAWKTYGRINKKRLGKKFKVIVTMDEEKQLWCFWIVFLPAKPGADVSIFVDKKRKCENFAGILKCFI